MSYNSTKDSSHPLPSGRYTCIIDGIDVSVNEKNVKVVTWDMMVVGGPHDGVMFKKKYHVVNDSVRDYLEKDLAMLGIQAKSSVELMQKRGIASNKLVLIEVVINQQGYPVYYLKGVSKDDGQPKSDEMAYDW